MSLTALTDEQYAHIKEAWRLFDTDGDGIVTPQDLQKILRSFGYDHSLEELEVFLDDLPVCVEKDRCLDMPEFILWTLKLAEVIEQEDRAEMMAYEEGLENFEGLDVYKKLVRKELINTVRTNRMTLDDLETEVRQGDDREVFKAVDQDGNGFLTYQDIEKLSRDMGELMNFHQLNTIMDTASDDGTMRRLPFERFEELCRHPVAWNELDMLPCHEELLRNQTEERSYQARRKGEGPREEEEFVKESKTRGKKKGATPTPPVKKGGCTVC